MANSVYQTGGSGTLQQAYDGGTTIAADTTAVAISVANTENIVALSLAQNDTSNNPVALDIVNTGTGNDVDGSNFTISKAGTVDAVSLTDGTATLTGGALTGLTTPLTFPQGGTGLASWTQYLIPYASTTTAVGQIAIGTSGQVLTSNGAGAAPTFQAASGGLTLVGTVSVETAATRGTISGLSADKVYFAVVSGESNHASFVPTFFINSNFSTGYLQTYSGYSAGQVGGTSTAGIYLGGASGTTVGSGLTFSGYMWLIHNDSQSETGYHCRGYNETQETVDTSGRFNATITAINFGYGGSAVNSTWRMSLYEIGDHP